MNLWWLAYLIIAGLLPGNTWLRIIKYLNHGHMNTSNGTLESYEELLFATKVQFTRATLLNVFTTLGVRMNHRKYVKDVKVENLKC